MKLNTDMRILVIEDDLKIQQLVSRGLRLEGHTVELAADGAQGLELWRTQRYDAVILDLMLPTIDGLQILRQMRHSGDRTPVIVLSAKVSVDERITGLQSGADDYLIKPFAFSELSARIKAITRRNPQQESAEGSATALVNGTVEVDLLRRKVTRATRRIELQPREFALLELLMRVPDRPLSKSVILAEIWDSEVDPQTNIVDVLICRLRNKIDAGFDHKLIQTIRGVGYVFRSEK